MSVQLGGGYKNLSSAAVGLNDIAGPLILGIRMVS